MAFPHVPVATVQRSRILGLGASIPDKALTNADLSLMVETDDEWIFSRTGIRERRILGPDLRMAEMAAEACRRAVANARLSIDDIDLLIVCTYTSERLCPSAACEVQGLLGMGTRPAFDVNAACSGFMYGLQTADAMVRAGTYRRVLVVGSEAQSRFTDYTDRTTCILFGDGAGAAVVGAAEEGSDTGIVRILLGADAKGNDLITIRNNHPTEPDKSPYAGCSPYIKMNGREVYKFAVRAVGQVLDDVLEQAGMTRDQVDLLVPHQANIRIIDAAAERLGLPKERVVVNIERYGNTAAASIPITLEEAARTGRLKPGMMVALVGFGGGFTYGAALIRW
jgi:3-oxoacyl-[acyl-carrier-protein] synthase III